jgi:gluconate 2-dehydrogenase gamma chain
MSELDQARDETEERPKRQISRRAFLQGSSAAAAAGGIGAAGIVIREVHAQDATPNAAGTPAAPSHDHAAATEERAAEFFTIHEAETVEALTARIIPGAADDPGAREAGVVFYIDRTLSGTNFGFDLKTYNQGPFPVTEEAETPVEASSSPDLYRAVLVSTEKISRYGFQSVMTPQDMYRRGLAFVDAYAQSTYQKDFIELDESQQDEVLTAMQADEATGFEGPSASAFFTLLRNDTIKGMFSDPMYGGNHEMVGWKLIGYPGAQRFYSSDDIKNTSFSREPQSLAQLMAVEGH